MNRKKKTIELQCKLFTFHPNSKRAINSPRFLLLSKLVYKSIKTYELQWINKTYAWLLKHWLNEQQSDLMKFLTNL